jgi:hypothetical protein
MTAVLLIFVILPVFVMVYVYLTVLVLPRYRRSVLEEWDNNVELWTYREAVFFFKKFLKEDLKRKKGKERG